MSEDELGKVYGEMFPRVGQTEKERLRWAIELITRRDLKTPGDWSNLRLELAAFIHLGKYDFGISGSKEGVEPDENDAHRILDGWKKNFATLFTQHKAVTIPAKPAQILWDQKQKRPFLHYDYDDDYVVVATRPLLDLFLKYGNLVHRCTAPATRSKAGELCGKWFVANRPDQEYCDSTCRSRASTKAKRERDEQLSRKTKAKKKKRMKK